MASFSLNALHLIHKNLISSCSKTLLRRPVGYKSAISLENLYPNSSLKISTPAFSPDPKEKFSGYIPMDKLEITYSASSGPGGQNVNKVHTKVDLRFKPSEAKWLDPSIRSRLIEMCSKQLTKEGYLVLRSDVTRYQQLNVAHCLQRLRELIRAADQPPPSRDPETVETIRKRHLKAARLRVAEKREASQLRAQARPPTLHDL